jgi:hypothetical protein
VSFNAFSQAYDSRRLRWILLGFVGTDPSPKKIEAWSLTVGAQPRWSKLAFDGALPANLYGAGIAYDALRDRLVAFGGGTGPGSTDVNALDLSGTLRWRSIANGGSLPHSRSGASLTFDPARDRYLMFGGVTVRQTPIEPEITTYSDVWSLHLNATATWDSVRTSGSRVGQWGPLAFFDPARDGLGVVGGQTWVSNVAVQDLHELSLGDPASWDTWPDRSVSAPPGNRLGAYLQMEYTADLGLDRVVSIRDGRQVWMLERGTPTHTALLDLEPNDATNTLRADAHGLVTCAILSDAAFDARTVDPATVTLAGAPASAPAAADRATLRDVNGDGRVDRVLKFARAEMTLDPSVDVVALAGKTRTGDAVVGWDLYRLDGAAGNGRGVNASGLAAAGDPDAPNSGPLRVPAQLELAIAGPVRGAAAVRLGLPHAASDGVLEIFSVDGRRVAHRDLGALAAGERAIALGETATLASGVYFARVRVAGETVRAKFVVLR